MAAKNTEIIVGIVVLATKVRDNDVRVRLLTATGLHSYTATGALKSGAKLKNAVQLFTVAEFSAIGHKIVGAHVLQTNHAITRDIRRYYLACAICDVVSRCQGAGFLLTVKALDDLCAPDANTRAVFTEYFSALLVELGFDTESDTDINTSYVRHLDIQIPNTKHFL